MRRWLVNGFITTYLGALGMGIFAHAMNFGTGAHPLMYFVVWDMFCGWSCYETRYHVLGEGESGEIYQLCPPPWNDFSPFGDISRHDYDPFGNHLPRMALNTLKHTSHEPMVRLMVVEENWNKKFNLPDDLWAYKFDEPKQPHSYFWLSKTMTPDGSTLTSNHAWYAESNQQALFNNPRLHQELKRSQPVFTIDRSQRFLGGLSDSPPAVANHSTN